MHLKGKGLGGGWGGGRARGILAIVVGRTGPTLDVTGEGGANRLVLGSNVLEGVASCPSRKPGIFEGVERIADLKGGGFWLVTAQGGSCCWVVVLNS